MQHIHRSAAARKAYHEALQGDHDYSVWVEVLTINERHVGSLDILDGQVNISDGDDGPCRTASLVISDPEGTMHYGTDYLRDPKGILWINRLIQVWHSIQVPGYGTWETSVIVGLPTAISRTGAEVNMELGDKSLLADHGVRPRTYKKGTQVDHALRQILREQTGEEHFRIPKTNKRLSRPYTVGMGEDALTPWQAVKRIAGQEMGWRTFYDGRGFAVCEPTSAAKRPVDIDDLLAVPESSTSFMDFSNYVRMTSHRAPSNKTKGKQESEQKGPEITIIRDSVVALKKSHELSQESLARNGVNRTLPLVEVNDDLKTIGETTDEAIKILKKNTGLGQEKSFEVIPMYHLDPFDRVRLPGGIGVVRLTEASIPLGVGGNMVIGDHKWVSKPVKVRRLRRKVTVKKKKQKGGKSSGS